MNEQKSEPEVAKPQPAPTRKRLPRLQTPKPPEPPAKTSRWLRLVRSPLFWAALWPALLVFSSTVLWKQWGHVRLGEDYGPLSEQMFRINAPPSYVARNVTADIFRSHQLDKVSLLDRNTTSIVCEALQTHPWVEEVLRVEKSATGVAAQVRYRIPVAMVRVISQHQDVSGPAVCVVDGKGILLPTEGFHESDVPNFLQIEVDGTYPTGVSYGMPFSDLRVIAASRIAALLTRFREECGLVSIRLTNPQRTFNEPWHFVVIRRDGSMIIWGSPPGEEQPGELKADAKIAMLRTSPQEIRDLRVARTPAPVDSLAPR